MKDFLEAFQIVFPTMVYMGSGALIRKAGWIDEDEIKRLNLLIFRFFIPVSIFTSLYAADLNEIDAPSLFIFCAAGIIFVFLLCYILFSKMYSNKEICATMTQGVYRSCYVLIGIPVALALSNNTGDGRLAALAGVVAPVNTILAVWLFEHAKGEKITKRELFIKILMNPLVLACLLGIFFQLIKKPLPSVFVDSLSRMAEVTVPFALIVLGASLRFSGLKKNWKMVALACLLGLVIVPGIAIGIAVMIGFRGALLAAVIGAFAAPNDLVSAPMAQAMGGDYELASEIVAVSTVLSIFTLFLAITFVLHFGLITL